MTLSHLSQEKMGRSGGKKKTQKKPPEKDEKTIISETEVCLCTHQVSLGSWGGGMRTHHSTNYRVQERPRQRPAAALMESKPKLFVMLLKSISV